MRANFSALYVFSVRNAHSYALSRPIEPRQKSVSSRVTFCNDAADETSRKMAHACATR